VKTISRIALPFLYYKPVNYGADATLFGFEGLDKPENPEKNLRRPASDGAPCCRMKA
jgi:hypothetical protein